MKFQIKVIKFAEKYTRQETRRKFKIYMRIPYYRCKVRNFDCTASKQKWPLYKLQLYAKHDEHHQQSQ